MKDNSKPNISNFSIFADLDEKTLRFLNREREIRVLKRGDRIYEEGTSPTGIFCVHEGHVKAIKTGSDGKEQIIYLSKPGDIIGWQQIACDDPYSTSGVALENVVVSHIPKDKFLEVINDNSLTVALTKYICSNIVRLESKVLELSQKSVRERLATNILILYEKFGVPHGEQIVIGVPLTREDWANLIGTNTETVIKLLSELRREGHIEFVDRRILILNINALKKFSDFYR
jgi:CRP/FNR family transcriptional regulator